MLGDFGCLGLPRFRKVSKNAQATVQAFIALTALIRLSEGRLENSHWTREQEDKMQPRQLQLADRTQKRNSKTSGNKTGL